MICGPHWRRGPVRPGKGSCADTRVRPGGGGRVRHLVVGGGGVAFSETRVARHRVARLCSQHACATKRQSCRKFSVLTAGRVVHQGQKSGCVRPRQGTEICNLGGAVCTGFLEISPVGFVPSSPGFLCKIAGKSPENMENFARFTARGEKHRILSRLWLSWFFSVPKKANKHKQLFGIIPGTPGGLKCLRVAFSKIC